MLLCKKINVVVINYLHHVTILDTQKTKINCVNWYMCILLTW